MWRQRVPLTSICKVIHSNASSYLRCLLLPALKLQSNRSVFHALYARIHIIDKEQCKATVVFEASWINCIKVKNRIICISPILYMSQKYFKLPLNLPYNLTLFTVFWFWSLSITGKLSHIWIASFKETCYSIYSYFAKNAANHSDQFQFLTEILCVWTQNLKEFNYSGKDHLWDLFSCFFP